MLIKQIIEILQALPQDAELKAAYEGEIQTFEIINIQIEDDGEIVLEFRDE